MGLLIFGFVLGLSAPALSQSVTAASTGREDAETLLRRVIDSLERQQEIARQYAFRERVSTSHLDSDGSVGKAESETFLVTPGPGGEYRRLVAKNGEPLSSQEEAKEERKFQKYLDEQLRRPAAERDRETAEKLERRVERYRKRLEESLEAFDFEALPDTFWDGESVRVFRFSPKPGYEGHSRATKILARMEGTVFVDPRRNQLARLQVRFRESLKFLGGLFGRVSEGSEAMAEGFVEDGVWLVDRVEVSLDARFYFLKKYRRRITLDFHDYAKYTVETQERVGARISR